MPETPVLSKIKLNNIEYELKDAKARPLIVDATWAGLEEEHDRDIPEYYLFYINRNKEIELIDALENHRPIFLNIIIPDNMVHQYLSTGTWIPLYYQETYQIPYGSLVIGGSMNVCICAILNLFLDYDTPGTSEYPIDLEIGFYDINEHIPTVPTLETSSNVASMLTSLGLNANANLQPAAAGSAQTGSAVVQSP